MGRKGVKMSGNGIGWEWAENEWKWVGADRSTVYYNPLAHSSAHQKLRIHEDISADFDFEKMSCFILGN